jgi:hypothetical protein
MAGTSDTERPLRRLHVIVLAIAALSVVPLFGQARHPYRWRSSGRNRSIFPIAIYLPARGD